LGEGDGRWLLRCGGDRDGMSGSVSSAVVAPAATAAAAADDDDDSAHGHTDRQTDTQK